MVHERNGFKHGRDGVEPTSEKAVINSFINHIT